MVGLHPRNPIDALADLVRVVVAVSPRRVILFGSAARGEMTPQSDLDLLVVLPDGTDTTAAELAIYRQLWGLRFGADIIAVTEHDVERSRANPSVVIHTPLRQGKELYRAAGRPSRRSARLEALPGPGRVLVTAGA